MKQLRNPDYTEIQNLDLKGLIVYYPSFEKKVQHELVWTVKCFFEIISGQPKGFEYFVNGVPVYVTVPPNQDSRTLSVSILPTNAFKAPPILTRVFSVNGAGIINKIQINYPRGLSKIIEQLGEILVDQTKDAYVIFESRFKSEFTKKKSAFSKT